MGVIDAHCHASSVWYEPVEALLFQMDRNGVERAVLTQILGRFDNNEQADTIACYPGRFAHVGAIDPAAPDAVDEIAIWAARGMAGLRLRADARSPGSDPLAIWRAAAEAGLAISCAGPAASFLLPAFATLAETFGDTPFVLEHLAGWVRPDCDRGQATWRDILALARLPNVLLKIPSLGQIAPRAVGAPLPARRPVLDEGQGRILLDLLAAFGSERLMWGSDFPLVSSREGYGNALHWTRDLFGACASEAVEAIFGGNAKRIFFSGQT